MGPVRRRVISSLGVLGVVATSFIATSTPAMAAAEDPLCYTTQSDTTPFYGTEPDDSASVVYDQRFSEGPAIPANLLAEHYTPQGTAAWRNWNGTSEDLILISAYKDADGNKEPDGPSAVFGVVASGSRTGTGLGRMLIDQGHVGGIGVYKGWLYVGSEKEIRFHKLDQVRRALEGADSDRTFPSFDSRPTIYDVAFMGTGDGRLWAGSFDDKNATHLNGYVQTDNAKGTLAFEKSTQAYAPKKTQGVVVTPTQVIFSTSFKRGNRGNLWVMPRNQHSLTDTNSYCFRVPSMNEGVTVLNGRLYLGYESAAYTYTWNPGDLPRNIIDHLHSAALTDVTGLPVGDPAAD